MSKTAAISGADRELTKALRGLEKAVASIPKQFEYVIHPGKHLFLTYMYGIVYGLGALTAVAIIIPLIVSVLHRVSWVPLVGDFVERVVTRVEESQQR